MGVAEGSAVVGISAGVTDGGIVTMGKTWLYVG